jgi:hypothetical protein
VNGKPGIDKENILASMVSAIAGNSKNIKNI